VVVLFAGLPALVLGAVSWAAGGVVAGVVVLVAVGAAAAIWARFGGERRVLAAIRGQDADPVSHARLVNLVEGLSIGAGLRQPRLLVLDRPGLNAVAAGTSPNRAVLGVTSALLSELDRVELEAVLAEELMQIRRRETMPGTVLAATFGLGRSLALPADHDVMADQAALTLTRYPPALASALEKLEAEGATVDGQPTYMSHLWLADPNSVPRRTRGRLPLRERIEALREL
jgi:heat shock protein HtpX